MTSEIRVKIIVYGLQEQQKKDTLEARMVEARLATLQSEFELNDIPTEII